MDRDELEVDLLLVEDGRDTLRADGAEGLSDGDEGSYQNKQGHSRHSPCHSEKRL